MPKLTHRVYQLTDSDALAELLADVDREMTALDARVNRTLAARITAMRTRVEPEVRKDRDADRLKLVVL